MSNQLLFLTLLTLERERTPEGQRGAAKWCLLHHLLLHRSTKIQMQCCYTEQVTAALERNPPHRTLWFLLVCVPYCFSLQPPSENQGKNQNENLVLLTAKLSHLNKRFRAVSNGYFVHVFFFKTEIVSWDVLPTSKAVDRSGLSHPLYFHFSNAKIH